MALRTPLSQKQYFALAVTSLRRLRLNPPNRLITIEKFFGWWKRHLRVYHLIARSKHGLMVQILSGLITYFLLAIYCHEQHGEQVSIKRVRELRIKIQKETREFEESRPPDPDDLNSQQLELLYASSYSTFTVLAWGPFSPDSSTKRTFIPILRSLNLSPSTLFL